jgi:TolB protein
MLKIVYKQATAVTFMLVMVLTQSPAQESAPPVAAGQVRDQLRIIVRPSGQPTMAVTDYISLNRDAASLASEFSQTLFDDLDFAGVTNIISKSLYPELAITDPQKTDFSRWLKDPVRANYLTFGNVLSASEEVITETYLYDTQTGHRLLATQQRGHTNRTRQLAHQVADEIVKLLIGVEGIASSRIALVSDRTGYREIHTMDYDGQNLRQFTFERGINLFPNWSPDGLKIAYLSLSDGEAFVRIRSAVDGLLLGTLHFKGTITSPVFSPDGTRLAFCSSKDSNSLQLYVADIKSGNIRQLTNTRSVVYTSPRWNPRTGREIALISDQSGSPQIYVVDSEGGNTRRLLDKGGWADSPSWSPNGQYLAFTWRPPGLSSFDIFIMDIPSGQIVQLTDGPGSNESPAWSPDGRHLVFQSNRSGRFELYLMHIDGTGIKQVTTGGGRSPAWGKRTGS